MQSTASCAWQAESSVDTEHARKILVCCYAELCRTAYKTALTVAAHLHATQLPVKPTPRCIVAALRREICCRNGVLHTLQPLLEYVLAHKKLPDAPIVDECIVRRLFEHFSGASSLLKPAQAADTVSLGDALFDCLTRGVVLCGRVETARNAWSLSRPHARDLADNVPPCKCQCSTCVDVYAIEANWEQARVEASELQAAVLQQCESLEGRVHALALVL